MPPLDDPLRLALLLLPCYLTLQIVPLPIRFLEMISPTRANMVKAATPVMGEIHWAPLTVDISQTLFGLFSVLACILVFILIRELTWRFAEKPWASVVPIILIGLFQAALGLKQALAGRPGTVATGTYLNRNHFAGFLEMVLPLAILGATVTFRARRLQGNSVIVSRLLAISALGITAVLFLSIVYSLSRTATVLSILILAITITYTLSSRFALTESRLFLPAICGLAIAIPLFLLLPSRLHKRFEQSATTDLSVDGTRVMMWRDASALIADFWITGCGFQTFESVFPEYQRNSLKFRIEYAHNDYVQAAAELGVTGCAIVAVLAFGVVKSIRRQALSGRSEDARLLATACILSIACMLIHSLVDFNLYIPANAFALAWIGGAGCTATSVV